MGVTGMMVMCHVQSWTLCYVTKYQMLLQFIALDIKTNFISGLIDRTVNDITQFALN